MTTLHPEESTTTAAAEYETRTTSTTDDTSGLQTEASTTRAMPKTEDVHTTTLPQTEITINTKASSTIAESTTTVQPK